MDRSRGEGTLSVSRNGESEYYYILAAKFAKFEKWHYSNYLGCAQIRVLRCNKRACFTLLGQAQFTFAFSIKCLGYRGIPWRAHRGSYVGSYARALAARYIACTILDLVPTGASG
jgi:hypothetical protein